MSKISVAIATYNEEENIGSCLQSVKGWVDEIIVVDGSSTDKTAAIAKKSGAKVFITTNKPMFHLNKQMAIDKAKGEWILQLDADEVVSEALKKEILKIVKKGSELAAFNLPRKNFFIGHWLRKGGQYPDYVIRFFKKGKAFLPCQSVHEQMKVRGKVGYLKGHLLHYSVPTFSRYLTNANRYTSLTATNFQERKISINLFSILYYLFTKPLWTFLAIYIRHKGFQDGFPGFIFALFSAFHWPIAFIKYWELVKNSKRSKLQ
jgi:(heptosyl)LPS beta-1,4-glucosyltransferase